MTVLIDQPTVQPMRKVTAVGIGAALSVIVIWIFNTYLLSRPLPPEVASAITAVISAGMGYFVRERATR